MSKEIYIFLGAVIGAIFAYISATIAARAQHKVARLNADKDITLQRDRLSEERHRSELSIERGKLDVLHRTLSRIALENSQTMSFMQSDAKLSVTEFRARYLDNCERLHEAMAIVDIYYPKMSTALHEVYGQSSIFWGYQEKLLQTDSGTNSTGWNSLLSEVLKAGDAIGSRSRQLKDDIARRAKQLTERLGVEP